LLSAYLAAAPWGYGYRSRNRQVVTLTQADDPIDMPEFALRCRVADLHWGHGSTCGVGDSCNDDGIALNIPHYVDTFEEESEFNLVGVRAERLKIKAELAELEAKMDGYLKEQGYL
jgi:hypothetical protein